MIWKTAKKKVKHDSGYWVVENIQIEIFGYLKNLVRFQFKGRPSQTFDYPNRKSF